MADLTLLSINRSEIAKWPSAKDLTDEKVEELLKDLWNGYENVPLTCFLCDTELQSFPPFTVFLPEPLSRLKAIAAPLCQPCWSLPQMVRLNRCMNLLRQMHKARKTGRQFHFDSVRKRW